MTPEHNPYAPPRAVVGEQPGTPSAATVPPLWNPVAATRWSLLFSPIFGAALHMLNWRAMGDEAQAQKAKSWLVGTSAVTAVLLVATVLLPESKALDALSRAAGLGMLFAWYIGAAREQHQAVSGRYGTDYPRRGWGKPLLFGLLGYVGIFALAFVVALGLSLLGVDF